VVASMSVMPATRVSVGLRALEADRRRGRRRPRATSAHTGRENERSPKTIVVMARTSTEFGGLVIPGRWACWPPL
jgi:hypothetical protein